MKNFFEKIRTSNRYSNVPYAVISIFVLAAIVILSESSLADQLLDDGPLATEPLVQEISPQQEIPQLTAEEYNLVVAIAEQDSRVQMAIAGSDYGVETVGVWHTEETLEKIGGAVIFEFTEPVDIEMDWPSMQFEDTVAGTYLESTRHFKATNVTQLIVLVDLRSSKVVSIGSGPGSVIVP